jgi:hypothetical protein
MHPADLTAEANPIIGDTDPSTARRLQAVLTGMSLQARRHLIDILIDTVCRSAQQPSIPAAVKHLSQPSPRPVPVPGGSARRPDSASGYAGEWGVKISSGIALCAGYDSAWRRGPERRDCQAPQWTIAYWPPMKRWPTR